MQLCNDSFLTQLEQEGDVGKYLNKVEGNKVRLLQLSDLHLFTNTTDSLDLDKEVGDHEKRTQRLVSRWRTKFTEDREEATFHGLVISGDLIDARKISEQLSKVPDTRRPITERCHKFATLVIRKIIESLQIKQPNMVPCLVIPGNHDVQQDQEKPGTTGKPDRIDSFRKNVHNYFELINSNNHDLISCPRLTLIGNDDGVVALIGLDSNRTAYRYKNMYQYGLVHSSQLDRVKRLVAILSSILRNTPLYPVVVLHHHLLPVEKFEEKRSGIEPEVEKLMVSVTLDSRDLIEQLPTARISLTTHGHMHAPLIQRVTYWQLEQGGKLPSLHVVACPSFHESEFIAPSSEAPPYSGGLVMTFDLYRGTVQADLIADRGNESIEKSVLLPLSSATRVTPAERRVYRRLCDWLQNSKHPVDDLPFSVGPDRGEDLYRYKDAVNYIWKKYGYTSVAAIPPRPENHRPKAGLSSNNLSRAGTELCETVCNIPLNLCSPYVLHKSYRLLVALASDAGQDYILLNNQIPIRDSAYGAWDAPLMPAFKNINDFLGNLRNDLNRIRNDLMICSPKQILQDQDKREGVIKALQALTGVRDEEIQNDLIDLATRDFIKFSPVDGQPQLYRLTLTVLPQFSWKDEEESGSLAPAIRPLDKVTEKHVFRWEPNYNSTVGIEPSEQARDGYIWFPLDKWHDCPAILARNADIMEWLQSELDKRRPSLPDWLYCGQSIKGNNFYYNIKDIQGIPFDETGRPDGSVPKGFPTSLKEGLKKVTLNPKRELASVHPYEAAEPKTVILCKENCQKTNRPRIMVYDPNARKPRGCLRPVQRYVLKSGLDRAKKLLTITKQYDCPVNELAQGKCGYLILNRALGDPIALLPPVLEPLPVDQRENQDFEEFIVCDGNHRVVEYCWNRGYKLQCVLLEGQIREPYYAHPSSSRDWYITALNALSAPPELYGKYTPRQPQEADHANTEEAKQWGANWYRRYYRDFNTGFKNIGIQGGGA